MKRRFFMPVLGCLIIGLISPRQAPAQAFRVDDPIQVDRDNLPTAKPKNSRINDYYDFFENTFFPRGEKLKRRAANINTLGEVPDSSWYTNRISRGAIASDALVRGPDKWIGPASGEWTVVGGKSQGISPGFRIQDARGDQYFLKFDPATNPEMATAAEVISTKFFHALGYNVPENYLVEFRPEDLRIESKATIENELGETLPLTKKQIDGLLGTVARRADGTIRAVASKRISSEDVGPFKFYGTRGDDANDIIPHEHRRELRGYYVFCSWLNHDDSRSINTRDFYMTEGALGYVKHYLIDFGSTLGSGSVVAQKRRPGNEYMWEAKPTFASIATFGMWMRPWVSVKYPDYPSIGRFEAEFFSPEAWKPEYPNVAFNHMDYEDAFWAVRQVVKFSDDDIRAVVKTGKLGDPQAERYLVQCLITRRNKIGNYWLRRVSSLNNFRIEGRELFFEDLLVVHGFESRMPEQRIRFASFDNHTRNRSELGSDAVANGSRIALPATITGAPDGSFFVVTLSAGSHFTEVFLEKDKRALRIVGIERK